MLEMDCFKNMAASLKVYKSTGDFEEASKMYMAYSAVDNSNKEMPWAEWRNIVVDRKQPRKMMVQANTVVQGNSNNTPAQFTY